MVGQADPREQLGDPRIDFGTAEAAGQAQGHGDVVGDGLRGQQVEVLEDHPDALAETAQAFGVEGGDVFALDQDAAAAGLLEAVDQAQQGALAGTGMADQAENLPGLDVQAGRLQGGDFPTGNSIGLVDVVEFDHWANLVGAAMLLRLEHGLGGKHGRSAKPSILPCFLMHY